MTQTLVIDYDGTYDPTLLNDRLVLGLKGTMSEFGMSLLRQHALESLRQKVRRGLVLTQVAIGFVNLMGSLSDAPITDRNGFSNLILGLHGKDGCVSKQDIAA